MDDNKAPKDNKAPLDNNTILDNAQTPHSEAECNKEKEELRKQILNLDEEMQKLQKQVSNCSGCQYYSYQKRLVQSENMKLSHSLKHTESRVSYYPHVINKTEQELNRAKATISTLQQEIATLKIAVESPQPTSTSDQ